MKTAFISAEVYPFSKVGGLGDVAGALPLELANLGIDIAVFTPGYGSIDRKSFAIESSPYRFRVRIGNDFVECGLSRWQSSVNSRLQVYFIENEAYFGSRSVYSELNGVPCADNPKRFYLFSKAVLEAFRVLNWIPQLIHCQDNHCALIPVYLKKASSDYRYLENSKTLLTLHNIAYQGITELSQWEMFNLPEDLFYPTAPLEWYGQVNPLKGGIIFADAVNTVSPTHAREITESQELSAGLKGVLASTGKRIYGILNGVDYREWNPATDRFIAKQYSPGTVSEKRWNRIALLKDMGFGQLDSDRPLIGMVSRLVEQKGIAILIESIERVMAMDVSMIVLGSGEPEYEKALLELSERFPGHLRIDFGYNNPLSHKIMAGADMFLMPSRYEPCGITQMAALKYGTVPIVHKTGGLADTIDNWNGETGNGFVFENYSSEALVGTIKKAVDAYRQKKIWKRIMGNGMACDFSWQRSAVQYHELYQSIIDGNK